MESITVSNVTKIATELTTVTSGDNFTQIINCSTIENATLFFQECQDMTGKSLSVIFINETFPVSTFVTLKGKLEKELRWKKKYG